MKGTIWCLHGMMGEAADWDGFRWEGWAVRKVDLWRYLACEPMGLERFGAVLNREMEAARELGGGNQVLMGYSMGGRLALQAVAGGGKWDGLVVVAAHPGLEDGEERRERREADAEWAARVMKDEWGDVVDAWLGQGLWRVGKGVGEAWRERRMGLVRRRREVARSLVSWSVGEQRPVWAEMRGWDFPVLWMVGGEDRKFRELAERAVGVLPRAELWVAEGVGHRVPWEDAENFRVRIREFLERLES